jgi:dienelactone hydrolase
MLISSFPLVALMNGPDCQDGYGSLVPAGFDHPLEVPARVGLAIPLTYPGRAAANIKTPIIFGICKTDSLCPADATEAYAKKASKSVIKLYDAGHFEIYHGKHRQVAMKDYISFLDDNLPIRAKL